MNRAAWVLRACLRRDYRIERSYPLAFALSVLSEIGTLAVFFYLSKLLGGASLHGDDLGRGYFPFVVVGLGVSRILEALLFAIPSRIRQDQLTGALEAVLSTPASPAVVALGYGAYDLLHAAIDTATFFAIAIVLFGVGLDASGPRVLAAALAFAAILVIFAAAGVAAAGLVIAYKRVQGALGIATTAVVVLGTVYFPASSLPAGLRLLAEANPLSWALALIRPLVTGAPVPWDRLALLIPTCVVLVALSLACVRFGVHRAKLRGTLGQY